MPGDSSGHGAPPGGAVAGMSSTTSRRVASTTWERIDRNLIRFQPLQRPRRLLVSGEQAEPPESRDAGESFSLTEEEAPWRKRPRTIRGGFARQTYLASVGRRKSSHKRPRTIRLAQKPMAHGHRPGVRREPGLRRQARDIHEFGRHPAHLRPHQHTLGLTNLL